MIRFLGCRLTCAPLMLAALISLAPLPASAFEKIQENWPAWRGPQANGVAPGGSYPTTWSETSHIRWKIELPGPGSSTPIVWGNQLFVTCGVEGKDSVVAYDRGGKQQWITTFASERPGKHKKATGSNPSIATDGKQLFAYFKSGTLACLDMAGKVVWEKNLQALYGEDTLWWDLGTSPVLTKDHVVVAVMQTGPSYLAAFDKSTGNVAWKQDRNLDAPSEAAQSYSTPVVIERDGKQLLVVLGADHVTCHDAASGKELWRLGGLNPTGQKFFRSISSPVVSDDLVIAPYARGATTSAVRLGGQGDVTTTHLAWAKEKLGADVPTPVAYQGKVFVCGDKGQLTCVDAKTGNEVWTGTLEKNRNGFTASPTVAGGKLYVVREDGKTFVLDTGNEFKIIAENELADAYAIATPVFVDGQIFLRTLTHLYCIGE